MTSTHVWVPDASALNDFRRCPEFFRLRHKEGWNTRGESQPLREGRAGHAALKVWRETGDTEKAIAQLEAAWVMDRIAEEETADTFGDSSYGYLETVVRKYIELQQRRTGQYEIIQNEAYTEVPIVADKKLGVRLPHDDEQPDFVWGGISDYVIQFTYDKSVYVVDTKFSGSYFSNAFFSKFDWSLPMVGYVAQRVALGEACHGFFIDGVHLDRRYHKIREADFQMYGPVHVVPQQLYYWAKGVHRNLQWLDELRASDGPWPQYEQGCTAWNKPCPFQTVCRLPLELRQDELENNFITDFWSPANRGGA